MSGAAVFVNTNFFGVLVAQYRSTQAACVVFLAAHLSDCMAATWHGAVRGQRATVSDFSALVERNKKVFHFATCGYVVDNKTTIAL